jgi:hypothetical protein
MGKQKAHPRADGLSRTANPAFSTSPQLSGAPDPVTGFGEAVIPQVEHSVVKRTSILSFCGLRGPWLGPFLTGNLLPKTEAILEVPPNGKSIKSGSLNLTSHNPRAREISGRQLQRTREARY